MTRTTIDILTAFIVESNVNRDRLAIRFSGIAAPLNAMYVYFENGSIQVFVQ